MRNSRLISVELIRTIGCLTVIGLHVLQTYTGNDGALPKVFFLTLFSGTVAIFWFVTGFFLFDNKNYKVFLIKTFKRIWLPAIIISIISKLGYSLFCLATKGEIIIISSLIKEIVIGIFSFRNFSPSSSHFWYIYIYVLIVIGYPIFKKIVYFIDSNIKLEITFIATTFLLLLINELKANCVFEFGSHYFKAIIPATIEIVYGYIFYKNKEKFIGAYSTLISLFIIVIDVFTVTYFSINKSYGIREWFYPSSILCAISLSIICLNISNGIKKGNMSNSILYLGKRTLWIYIIHPYVIKVLSFTKITKNIAQLILKNFNMFTYSIYVLLILIIVFLISLMVLVVFDKLKIKFHIAN